MVLATIIRLEMAYPGVGILAGDSLQYLTVVTAHAVVMVFFMIMPLLFGAFANFLLPTQLGVHDVAFPRLNSAAFWFLPAGFLMLAQMVCIDRRYQRMNCFNIREVQTLLRSRYHPDRWDANEHHQFLHETVLGLRLKLSSLSSITPNMLLSYEYGLSSSTLNRTQLYYFHLEETTQSYWLYMFYCLTYRVKN
jgi:heme/copper-type cytochrome/quinol oxidase subunit 1